MAKKQNKTVRGFTLIELILVMAIFSIILFGMMQLINPVRKIYFRTADYESSATAVDNMRSYLEGNISSAEFLHVYYGDLDGVVTQDAVVREFVYNYHINRVVFDNSFGTTDADSCQYDTVDIHVIKVDNADGGKISKQIFEVNTEGEEDVTGSGYPYRLVHNPVLAEDTEFAVNRVFYDDYDYDIILGHSSDAGFVPVTHEDFALTLTAYPKRTTVSYDATGAAESIASIGLSNIIANFGRFDLDQVPKLKADGTVEKDASGNDVMRDNVKTMGFYTTKDPITQVVDKVRYNSTTFAAYNHMPAGSLVDDVPNQIYFVFSYSPF